MELEDSMYVKASLTPRCMAEFSKRGSSASSGVVPNRDAIFMQVGSPYHTFMYSKSFITSSGLELLDWPGDSPDLNPIEREPMDHHYGQTGVSCL